MQNQNNINFTKQGGMTRRRMLKYSASMAATLMPPTVRRAPAQEPTRQASLKDIKHVVVLMQENCSFDHYRAVLVTKSGSGSKDMIE